MSGREDVLRAAEEWLKSSRLKLESAQKDFEDAQRTWMTLTGTGRVIEAAPGVSSGTSRPQRKRSNKPTQLDCVYKALATRGQPTHLDQLIEDVRRLDGVELVKGNIGGALYKAVKKQKRFTNPDKGMFGLLKWEADVDTEPGADSSGVEVGGMIKDDGV